MNRLIKNELIKILKKKSFIIMLIIIILFMLINNILYFKSSKAQNSGDLEELQSQYKELVEVRDGIKYIEKMKKEGKTEKIFGSSEYEEYQSYIKEYDQEELNNQIEELEFLINNSEINNRYILKDILEQYDILIIIYVIMIAGTIISEEFNKGTIKLLLVKPYSRIQIFISKFVATIIMLVVSIIAIIALQTIIGGCFFGFSSIATPVIVETADGYEHINVYSYILNSLVAVSPRYLIIIAIALACSTIMLSSSMSIIIPICIYLFADTINGLMELIDTGFLHYVLRFLITLNWNFTSYLYGGSAPIESLSKGFSICVCVAYFVIIMGAAVRSFTKRDIKNI